MFLKCSWVFGHNWASCSYPEVLDLETIVCSAGNLAFKNTLKIHFSKRFLPLSGQIFRSQNFAPLQCSIQTKWKTKKLLYPRKIPALYIPSWHIIYFFLFSDLFKGSGYTRKSIIKLCLETLLKVSLVIFITKLRLQNFF